MDKFEEFKKNKTKILYRGEKYKVIDVKQITVNNISITMLQIPDKKYEIWINADNVIKC